MGARKPQRTAMKTTLGADSEQKTEATGQAVVDGSALLVLTAIVEHSVLAATFSRRT